MALRALLCVVLCLAGAAAQSPPALANTTSAPVSRLSAAVSSVLLEGGIPAGARVHAVHANSSEVELLRNWARACRVGRIPNLLLLALDAEAAAVGLRLGLPTFECVSESLAAAAVASPP